MPAKILNAFTDENPDLHKQIGCMTGILQMFDRQHLLTGRRPGDQSHKKHPSGRALSNGRNYGEVYNSSSQQILLESNLSKSLNENRRVSIDSSRASCSSSSSSSSSSFLDCNKSMQQDAASFDRTFFDERSLNPKAYESDGKSTTCSSVATATIQHSQKYNDLRNVVKDSMHKDGKNLLPVKTSMREERDQAAKQRNSPRLQFLSKETEGAYGTRIDSRPKAPEDVSESVRALLKLKQARLGFSEDATKDSSCHQVARESPRFSCDGREFSRAPVDSRDDTKAIIAKLRDLPRLSLDSRARSSNLVSRANSLMEDLNRTTTTTPRLCKASSLHEDPGCYMRPPGLVAKLMGLEKLPNSQESNNKQTNGSFMTSSLAKSPKSARSMKENKVSDSPRSSTPKTKSCGPSVKQNSRITTEAAPWVQQERGRVVRRTAVGCPETKTKQRTASVYSEIVKKLKELEFQQSNKDLRALKQILDGMHAKVLLEATKDNEQTPPPPIHGNLREQIPARKHLTKSGGSPRAFEFPILLVKPAKSVSKSGVPPLPPTGNQSGPPRLRTSSTCDRSKESATSKTDKDQSPRVSPRLHNAQALLSADKQLGRLAGEITAQKPRSNPLQSLLKLRDDNGSATANSCSVSPRLQQRRIEAEKKQAIASSELSKAQKLSVNRQHVESVSPRGKFKLKQATTQIQKIEDKANGSPRETRNSSCQSAISKWSDKNITLPSLVDLEAIRTNRSMEMKSALLQQGLLQSPSNRLVSSATPVLNQKNSLPILNEYTSNKEMSSLAFDQASPVSVLDTSFYQDGLSTSPVKRTMNAPKDDETIDDSRCFTSSPDSKPTKLSSEVITPNRREVLTDVVQEDRIPNSTVAQLQATDSTTSKCDMVNPDHKYVAEILQATGLLQKDLSIGSKCRFPAQTHSSGQAINPDLFFVLEQLKPSRPPRPEPAQQDHQPTPVSDKSHRKLVFDVVNEILAQKLDLMASDNRLQFQIPDRKINGQRLLHELCSDMDKLQEQDSKKSGRLDDYVDAISGEDILLQTRGWTDFRTERHEMVLEIERLIFKDLISDILSDVTGPRSGQANC